MAEGHAFELVIERAKNYQNAFELYKSATEHGITTVMACVGLMYKV
jgi:TPR repeat protein